jgi:diketogulonate reductase-like aldo/keto reductase
VRAHRPVERNALWRARVRAPGRAARPAARGQRAEPVLPGQPRLENGLDETMHRLGVSLLAYSPLGFGLLTGKYDESGTEGPTRPRRRASPNSSRCANSAGAAPRRWPPRAATTRWRAPRPDAHAMALAFCYTKWQVASTIIGVTSVAQLDEDLDAWGTKLSPEVLAEIDKIRWECATRPCKPSSLASAAERAAGHRGAKRKQPWGLISTSAKRRPPPC